MYLLQDDSLFEELEAVHADEDVAIGVHLEQVTELGVEPETSVGEIPRPGQTHSYSCTAR